MVSKKVVVIIAIIIILLIAVSLFFILKKTPLSFSFSGADFSAGSKVIDSVGSAANKNVFEDVKLNPFEKTK